MTTGQKELPSGWKWVKLGDVCNIKMGNSPRGDTYNTKGVGTPLLNGPTEFGDRNPTPIQWTTEPTRLCENGDILLCVRGNTTGRMNWADQTYCIGRGLAAISPASNAVTNEYLFEALQSKMSVLLGQLSSGSVFPNISKNYLSEFTMPIPPSNIQEQFSSTISDLKEMKSLQTITRYDIEELKSSLLQRAFRGEL